MVDHHIPYSEGLFSRVNPIFTHILKYPKIINRDFPPPPLRVFKRAVPAAAAVLLLFLPFAVWSTWWRRPGAPRPNFGQGTCNRSLFAGVWRWLVVDLPLWKNMKVSWEDEIPNMGGKKMFQTTNQCFFVCNRQFLGSLHGEHINEGKSFWNVAGQQRSGNGHPALISVAKWRHNTFHPARPTWYRHT